ncbi:protein-tyrosine phosphatase family protein [Melittangium boletus]|uniref:Dual specificity protein phosphatase n=1 Tax=Melittangium boletus DSM 14713 TaxID=1294270 RepID=A0A250IS89_9BACT|nr:dual specificity protein phosphatase family protein [Melittangium boletus]ATB33806.1 dual specificity protein phosphatase [Melittangium boletus DSM 14713]
MLESLEMNLDWVTPELMVGGRFPMEAAAHLAQRLGIRCVVDVRVECRDDEEVLRAHGITLLHLPTVDRCAISLPMIRDGVAWVGERLARGDKVFIHCEHGIGRSALLALCVLVSRGYAPREALALAKRQRPKVSPSPEQLEAFLAFAREWKQAHAAAWAVPVFDELAAIAYSHLRTS